jgi:hypothetical protein
MCHTKETMEHILIKCGANPVGTIVWDLAQSYWPHAGEHWPTPSFGIILGYGSRAIPDTPEDGRKGENDRDGTKEAPIVPPEPAYLIWDMMHDAVSDTAERTHE